MIAIKYQDIVKQYKGNGQLSVDHVTAEIREGEFITILGSSGCGKTTLLKMTNRLIDPTNGQIHLFGEDISTVDPAIREAAIGIGMTKMQVLLKVQIPLARKALFAGIRLAIVSTIGIGTIAASINAGGLGTLLFDGLRTMNTVKILWGSILSAALAILTNSLLKIVENYSDRRVSDR